jgi:hypothetical protein
MVIQTRENNMKPRIEVKCVCCENSLNIGEECVVSPAGIFCKICTAKARIMFAVVERKIR